MMSIEAVWARIDDVTMPVGREIVPLRTAAGRCVAEAVDAPRDSPGFRQSAVDGFAFASLEGTTATVIGTTLAGGAHVSSLPVGAALRVMTGAPIPENTAGIAKQEDCALHEDRVERLVALHPAENIRAQGDVFRMGARLIDAGTVLTSGAIGLLASLGLQELSVRRQPRILHLATGDELTEAGQPLLPGHIYDVNGPLVAATLGEEGLHIQCLRTRDDKPECLAVLGEAAFDVLLISGGAGHGDRDLAALVLTELGFQIHVAGVNSRPGKPLIFGARGAQIAFGLPGNPLSQWVCTQVFVRRALARMAGTSPPELLSVEHPADASPVGDGRPTWTPACLGVSRGPRGDGLSRLMVTPLPWKHSGDLLALARANALLYRRPTDPSSSVSVLPCYRWIQHAVLSPG